MRDLRCIVVDDEPLAVKMIENFISRTEGVVLDSSYTDPVEALTAITERKPDLAFLDIQMPDLNGMDLSHMIPSDTRIIFTTAFKEYAFESYEVSALDFLLKPIRYQKFFEAVGKAKAFYAMKESAAQPAPASTQPAAQQAEQDCVYIKADRSLQKVMLNDILFVVGMKDYVMFHLSSTDKPVISHITMKAVEEMLPSSIFMRVHRSYIINLEKIDSIYPGNDLEIGKVLIHVSDAYKDAFNDYIKGRSL